ncbi:MAG: hypothetical protein ABEJ89_02135 [Haloarculaceae archaeon]
MATTTAEYEVEADPREERLYITLTGRLSADEIATAAERTEAAAERLDPGFDVVNDLRGFAPPSPDAAEPIKEAQAALVEGGVDRVVRIVDDDTSQVVVNAFARRSRDVGYEGMTADSVGEAERLLS